jgi:hypothetical protein
MTDYRCPCGCTIGFVITKGREFVEGEPIVACGCGNVLRPERHLTLVDDPCLARGTRREAAGATRAEERG